MTFLEAHSEVLAAIDFFSVEVLTFTGIIRYSVFFAIRVETREVQILGITDQCESWMKQIARNLNAYAERFVLWLRAPLQVRMSQETNSHPF